jgi:glycyl-tRNA synthetase beta chain
MPELFIELFGEEIPARMQARAAEDFSRLISEALAPLSPARMHTFFGPRRLALVADVSAEIAETRTTERGPRKTAPEQALAGFLRKHGASRDQLREEGDFLVLERVQAGISAATLIARELPGLLRRFPWPKSMRWGGTSQFTWVRPLRRISCLLDGAVIHFGLRDGGDDGHGLVSANITEGHRFLAPGAVEISSAADWADKLRLRKVLVDAKERRARIAEQIENLASAHQLRVVDDPGLLDEVTGLVEWPVALMGRIDDAFMDLPPEVMQVSMRVNQRYFALRDAAGNAAPHFIFVSNIEAADGGRTSIAGNERVLSARFSDARYFWDLDRQRTLESRVAALDGITFHAKLGSQGDRVRRLVKLAGEIAKLVGADVGLAQRAALLAKADLTTGMVGEFPELQGVMGSYYARHDGEDEAVAIAIREHYAPKGPSDMVPAEPVSISVALADKLDLLAGFFSIGEKPTGSGDPYALRRAALGVIRIVRENNRYLDLKAILAQAAQEFASSNDLVEDIWNFIEERLRVQLRGEGFRAEMITAARASYSGGDLLVLIARARSLTDYLAQPGGIAFYASYLRAINILSIEERRDGPYPPAFDPTILTLPEETRLIDTISKIEVDTVAVLRDDDFDAALGCLDSICKPIDSFFDSVVVNDKNATLRQNRLRLLSHFRATANRVADFSRIKGS